MKDFWSRYKRFKDLPAKDKKLSLKALFDLIHIWLALKILPFNKFKTYFKWLGNKRNSKINTTEYALAISRASLFAKNKFTCLPQALTLKKEFYVDTDVHLIIGVSPDLQKKLDAHAWVESNNQFIIGEVPDFNYLPLWHWT